MEYRVRTGARRIKLELDKSQDFSAETSIDVGDTKYKVRILEKTSAGEVRLLSINNKLFWVKTQRREDGFPFKIILNGTAYPVEIERVESTRYSPPAKKKKVDGAINASLPGQVTQVFVNPGDKVKAGQALCILEAMKMENEVMSPRDGVVSAVEVRPAQLVMKGQRLFEVNE